MEDSFSVRVKIETATNAVKKPVQRQTALSGLILSGMSGDMTVPAKEIKIPGRLSELIVQLFVKEGIDCSYSKGKISLGDITSTALWARCKELLAGTPSPHAWRPDFPVAARESP